MDHFLQKAKSIPDSPRLELAFFRQETTKVAEKLLGCVLVRRTDQGVCFKGRIVETEAYLGLKDDSCHSFGGTKTSRTQVMYLLGGRAYVYFTYGMYYCFNIVTAGLSEPEAVLIRALKPLKGIAEMQKNRRGLGKRALKKYNVLHLANGPGKLCQALNIQKDLNGTLMDSSKLYVEKGANLLKKDIATHTRQGLSPTKSSCYWPLRFYIKNNPFVSPSCPLT